MDTADRRVVVAMSGGVDSSVAAALLVEQGFEVIGITLKTFRYEDVGGPPSGETSCCSLDGINDARAVAAHLGIPHYVLDFSEPFGKSVIQPFIAEYLAGRTPNPCVLCNRTIKWEELLRKSTALGAGAIATGHYALVQHDPATGRYRLRRGVDAGKDQSYALWGLTQESLSRTIFPLGGMSKAEVREAGRRLGVKTADKGESFEICFVTDNNYERFLKDAVPGLDQRVQGGALVMDGKVVGTHRGYPFFTIGQRRGLGYAAGEPVFVKSIDPVTNQVELGRDADLYAMGLRASHVNMIRYADCTDPRRVHARIRYLDKGCMATALTTVDGHLDVHFDEPRRAITPGQSVVLYEDDDVVGGGIIDEAS